MRIEEDGDEDDSNHASNEPNDYLLRPTDAAAAAQRGGKPSKKEYTPIKSYKPSGNLVYDDDLLNKIEDKFI